VNGHVFLSEGCRLAAFCPATVDGEHVGHCEECSRTEFHRLLRRVRLEEPGGAEAEMHSMADDRLHLLPVVGHGESPPGGACIAYVNLAMTTALKTPSSASLFSQ